jgi:beta-glucanase (GH16 family)
VTYDSNGANLILAKQGDSPILQTTGYIFFGQLEVTMRAAAGTGIVSSLVLLSDDLDEVDWEFTGTDTTQVQSNYFGKGDTTTYDRAAWHGVANPQSTVHTYTFDWTPSAVTWSIDGNVVRTLNFNDAQGGARFPQTPMRVRLGIWAGGDPSNGEGTIEWAGGKTDYSQAPFSMSVQSVAIKNYSPGSGYTYSDTSGSYESIKIDGGSLMSNGDGAGSSASKARSLTTSLSIASQPSVQALTAAPTATAVRNVTNQTTLSTSPQKTGAGSSSSSSSGPKASNAAYHLDASDMTSMSSMLLGALALGMGLFF